jgi:hypothetical protein
VCASDASNLSGPARSRSPADGLERIRYALDEHERLDRIEATVETLTGLIGLAEHGERTDHRIEALAEAQRQTEERLKALIAVVDNTVRRPPPKT